MDIWVNNDFINRDMKSYQFKESYIHQNILRKSEVVRRDKTKNVFVTY